MPAAGTLTRNQSLVLGALSHAGGPLSAYDLLDRLRADGLRSPLQIYRALHPLMAQGLVHRLESLNSFVACAHLHKDEHDGEHGAAPHGGMVAFAICGACGRVEEFSDAGVAERLGAWSREHGFQTAKTVIELRGTCLACQVVQ